MAGAEQQPSATPKRLTLNPNLAGVLPELEKVEMG
jgi:hypothetical protein